jgi:hypothetical protein
MVTAKITETKRLSPHASTDVRRVQVLPVALVR